MNRRSFVAAVPALLPAVALSQEATPVTRDRDAEWLLMYYVMHVIGEEDFDALYDIMSADAIDVDQFYWRHVQYNANLRADGLRWTVQPMMTVGDGQDAMMYATTTTRSGERGAFFALRARDGLIQWFASTLED